MLKVPEKIKLIESKRSQNVEIILGKLRMSNSIMINSLFTLDEKVATNIHYFFLGEGEGALKIINTIDMTKNIKIL